MGKNNNNKYNNQNTVVEEVVGVTPEVIETVEEVVGATPETKEPVETEPEVIETDKEEVDITPPVDEETKEPVEETVLLGIYGIVDGLIKSDDLEKRLFGSELKDYITAIKARNEQQSNIANKKLYNIILRTLKNEAYENFKAKFDVINKLFLDKEVFEASNILYFAKWSKSANEISNFSQLVTIIEDLSDVKTRQENKKRIVNLTNLTIGDLAISNIKRYYKI